MSPNFPRCAMIFASRSRQIRFGMHVLIFIAVLAGAQSLFGAQVSSKAQRRIKISSSLAPAMIGAAYDSAISVSGGVAPYQFASPDLPSGLVLDSATGHISGIPQTAGLFSLTVEVHDANGNHQTAKLNLLITSQVAVNITLAPTSATVNSGTTAQFQAIVTHAWDTAVIWTASSGTVSASGLYTAPVVTSSTTAVLTAISAADSTKSASANITVAAPVGITLSPTTATVNSGSTAQFQASITNTSNTAVNWTASSGTVSGNGLYTAPVITTNTTAVLTATSAADSTKFATASISLIAPIVAVAVTPPTTTVNSGATAQFQASVTNTSNTGVTWTASAGTVSGSGMYTAPTVKTNTTALITATSTADSSKSASANVSLVAATPKVALQVLFPPTNPRTSDYKAVQTYLMNNPAVTGANLSVEWGMIDQGPTANPQYVWTAVDALIAPWVAAGKKVNLIVWANSDSSVATCSNGVASTTGNCAIPGYVWTLLGPSNYTSCNTQYGVQQIGNYLNRAAFQLPYQQFISATVQKYGTNPNIGYIRFGLGHGGESFPVSGWNDTTAACGQAFAAWGVTIASWETYLASMVAYESNLHSSKQLMVGVTPMGFPLSTVPDFLAPLVVPAGIGFGTQGFELADVIGYPTCNADWCNLFTLYAGQQPLELQTLLQSCPDNSCATGSLVDLIPFAISHHASVFEIYYQDWLLAFAPGYPGNSQYGSAYAQVLNNAANSNVQ